jgi:alkylhydroperoxidase family enzyme
LRRRWTSRRETGSRWRCRRRTGATTAWPAQLHRGQPGQIPADEIELNREGRSSDPKRQAAVAFAKALIETRGKVSDAQFAAVRDAGWTDANIVEMIALTAQFLLTNFMNNAVQTPIDFPEVSPAKAA